MPYANALKELYDRTKPYKDEIFKGMDKVELTVKLTSKKFKRVNFYKLNGFPLETWNKILTTIIPENPNRFLMYLQVINETDSDQNINYPEFKFWIIRKLSFIDKIKISNILYGREDIIINSIIHGILSDNKGALSFKNDLLKDLPPSFFFKTPLEIIEELIINNLFARVFKLPVEIGFKFYPGKYQVIDNNHSFESPEYEFRFHHQDSDDSLFKFKYSIINKQRSIVDN